MKYNHEKSFSVKDRFNFLVALVDQGVDFNKALFTSNMTLGECIYAHDYLMTDNQKLTIVEANSKLYKYMGTGQFRRVDKNGKPCVDGKSKEVNGAKKIGFVDNPLRYVFEE